MGREPLVSVVVPLYNYSRYIEDCIRSIQKQNYENWELFVVDDCSTDDSFAIAKKFEDDKRIQVFRTEVNSGYSKAKNEGIKASKGELITTLDADDMLTVDSLSLRVDYFINHDIDFINARAIIIGAKTNLEQAYSLSPDKIKSKNTTIHAQTVMLKRWIYQKFGLYDESLRSRADKEMWIRLFGESIPKEIEGEHIINGIKKKKTKDFVAFYRVHPSSMLRTRAKNPKLQAKLKKQLKESVTMRKKGISPDNTIFLEN